MDGRTARGLRNRQAIVDAALSLVTEQEALPTAQAVAARASVGTRSVFHHFPTLDSLLAEAADTQAARWWQVLQPPEPGHSLPERLAAAIAQRAQLFEQIGAVRRVAARHEPESPLLAERLRDSRMALRRHLRRALSPELARLERARAAGIEAAACWETWEVLRRHQNLSVTAATNAVTSIIESALLQPQTLPLTVKEH